MVDISRELAIIDTSSKGSEIKEAIMDALSIISQAEPNKFRPYDISTAIDFAWGSVGDCVVGIAQEVNN